MHQSSERSDAARYHDTNVSLFRLKRKKKIAPGEDRTHDLQIMRLTRCLLRYQGLDENKRLFKMEKKLLKCLFHYLKYGQGEA